MHLSLLATHPFVECPCLYIAVLFGVRLYNFSTEQPGANLELLSQITLMLHSLTLQLFLALRRNQLEPLAPHDWVSSD